MLRTNNRGTTLVHNAYALLLLTQVTRFDSRSVIHLIIFKHLHQPCSFFENLIKLLRILQRQLTMINYSTI